MVIKYHQKDSKKKHEKDTKIFLKKKKTKGISIIRKRKQKLSEYRRNYDLTNKKKLLGHFKDARAIKSISWINPSNVKKF